MESAGVGEGSRFHMKTLWVNLSSTWESASRAASALCQPAFIYKDCSKPLLEAALHFSWGEWVYASQVGHS